MKNESRVQAWREKRAAGEELVLPSGERVSVRRVHLLDLVQQGKVPDTLSGLVADVVGEGVKQVGVEELTEYVELVNLVCVAAFVDPPLALEASDEALGVNEVSFLDRAAVFEWCNKEARQLRPFREEQA